jgi:hypothetical protein
LEASRIASEYTGVGVLLRILLMGFKLAQQIDRRALAYLLAYRKYFVGTISRLWCWFTSELWPSTKRSGHRSSFAHDLAVVERHRIEFSEINARYPSEPFTFPTPDCANDAPFASMWCHCDGREYAHDV